MVILPLLLWGAIAIHRHHTRIHRRLDMLLQAFDAGDTSLRFPETADPRVNILLNRIASRLSEMKCRAVETDNYFGAIVSATATGVIVVNTEGHILLSNPAALRLLDRPALTFTTSLSESWPELAAFLAPPFASRSTRIRNLAVNSSIFTPADGRRLMIVTLDDISAQLDSASIESWMEMSRVLSHEIMNGIAPIISISDSLLTRYDGSEPYMTDSLEAIAESSRGLRNFVARYNRVTRVPRPEPSPFSLSTLLNHVSGLFHALPGADSVTLTTAIPTPDPVILADSGQITQILLNLLKNALEAGATQITISTRPTPPQPPLSTLHTLPIDITNDGTPISPADSERIFTPLFTTKPSGSGTGLSLSRRIANRNGGTLLLTALAPLTRFTLSLPTVESDRPNM
ncbi:MAG: ATP-binding protein [Staphylococcus sp.]|nr:ATP-binding protein [Staphylococcus sp.]